MINQSRAIFLAVSLALVFGVCSYISYNLGQASGEKQVRKMLEAGVAALAERQKLVVELRGKSLEDADRIAKLSRNARVRICKPARLPAGGSSTDTGTTGDGGTVGEDITPILRQCLRTFGEVNHVLQAQ